mmetsp:Transcript_9856/g.25931  ORF Transcript_9856/g.25931 Transcript_9856/m.25931 type:complete len:226 (-) Transcript_9856:2179-2856(-)
MNVPLCGRAADLLPQTAESRCRESRWPWQQREFPQASCQRHAHRRAALAVAVFHRQVRCDRWLGTRVAPHRGGGAHVLEFSGVQGAAAAHEKIRQFGCGGRSLALPRGEMRRYDVRGRRHLNLARAVGVRQARPRQRKVARRCVPPHPLCAGGLRTNHHGDHLERLRGPAIRIERLPRCHGWRDLSPALRMRPSRDRYSAARSGTAPLRNARPPLRDVVAMGAAA